MFTIIPVKPFSEAKSRLAPVLTSVERAYISQCLLQRTIQIAHQVGQVVVVSRSYRVRHFAKQLGAWALIEGELDLNRAIQQGINWAVAQGAETVLVLPSDLPRLTPLSLSRLSQLPRSFSPLVAIAPCQREEGTNALLLHPPTIIPVKFGSYSFSRHQQAARYIGITPHIIHDPALAFDLDLPEDWLALQPNELIFEGL